MAALLGRFSDPRRLQGVRLRQWAIAHAKPGNQENSAVGFPSFVFNCCDLLQKHAGKAARLSECGDGETSVQTRRQHSDLDVQREGENNRSSPADPGCAAGYIESVVVGIGCRIAPEQRRDVEVPVTTAIGHKELCQRTPRT